MTGADPRPTARGFVYGDCYYRFGAPAASVVIPTWQRHASLLDRCLPSVLSQTWQGEIEIVIVSDGPDPGLRTALQAELPAPAGRDICYLEVPDHGQARHWGSAARRLGCEKASGDYIAYLDDDDRYRPHHIATLVTALLRAPEARWAYSRMASHTPSGTAILGSTVPSCGTIGTPMIMHHRDLLDVAGWGEPSSTEDWDLVSKWMAAGVPFAALDDVTVDVWPSQFGQRP